MAKIKLGGLAQDVRGSQNGLTFSRNAGGAYVRAKASPVNTNTPQQMAARAYFSDNSKAWSTMLTDAQRAAFNAFALTHTITDVFGDTLSLSGIATFQRLNRTIQQVGGTPLVVPPANLDVSAITAQTITATAAAGHLATLVLNVDPDPLAANEEIYLFATVPIPAGVTNYQSLLRLVNTPADTFAPADDVFAEYNARFGNPTVIAGDRIGLLLCVANSVTGAVSAGLTAKIQVA